MSSPVLPGGRLSDGELAAVRMTGELAVKTITGALDSAGMVDTVARVGILVAAAHGEATRAGWPLVRLFRFAEQVFNQLGEKPGSKP